MPFRTLKDGEILFEVPRHVPRKKLLKKDQEIGKNEQETWSGSPGSVIFTHKGALMAEHHVTFWLCF